MLAQTVIPVLLNALTELMPLFTTLITSILPVIKVLIDALIPVITALAQVFMIALAGGIKAAVDAVKPVLENLIGIFESIITFITGVFTGNWTQAWEGIRGIFGGIFGGLVELVKAPFRLIVGVVNGVIGGLNKLKVPDWIRGIGGQGINIPTIPTFSRGSNYTPDTFIAGDVNGKGGKLVTGARGRKVFTAAETSSILDTINALRGMGPIVGMDMGDIFKNAQTTLSARKMESFNEPVMSIMPSRGETPITVHYEQTIHVDGNAPNDLEEILRKSNEQLVALIEERFRRRGDNERRMAYT